MTALPPPAGLAEGGTWGTTTYVGPKTFAFAIAAIPTIISPFIILLFCPLDTTDVYNLDGKLYTPDGVQFKAVSSHNFSITKSEHVVGGTPKGCSPNTDGAWGTTQHVGPLTWSAALVALPTILGTFVILLFMPLDNDDVYKDGDSLYLADGTLFKKLSHNNFDVRKSTHTNGTPEGLSDGTWGTMTYVGPLTLSLAIGALPTIIGSILILLFLPLDQEEVYKVEDKLYLPNGTMFKAANERNFMIRKSDHTDGTPKGLTNGEWGTSTYVGPLTFSLALISLLSGIGWIVILLLLPLDSEEVYKLKDVLYLPSGEQFKAATKNNFYKVNAKHVGTAPDIEEQEEVKETPEVEESLSC